MILDELRATSGWPRDYARKSLRQALGPRRMVNPRRPCPPAYSEDVLASLRKVWAVIDAPVGKRFAPFVGEIAGRLRACDELDIDDGASAKLNAISTATIEPMLAGQRQRPELQGRS